MFRLVLRAALAALVPLVAAAAAAGADEALYVLHAPTTAPQLVVGPPLAQRMAVSVRGLTRVAGRAYPTGGSFLGHAVTAVPLPADLRPDEPIVVRVEPATAGAPHLIPADGAVRSAVAAARASGLVLGILAMVVLIQIIAYVITREPSIPWYVGLVACLAAIVVARDYVPPANGGSAAILVLDLVSAVVGTGFIAVYLRLWTQARTMFWAVVAACAASIVIGVAGVAFTAFHGNAEALRVPLVFIFCAVLMTVTFLRARRYPPGWILFGGTWLLVASTAYRAVRSYVGTPFLDHWAFEIGATFDALVFSCAIVVAVRYALFERRSIERRLREATYEANHDDLTGALNRRGLFAKADALRGTLFAIDLDDFKSINDRFGHAAGDMVLVEVVRALRRLAGADGIVARVGGDEFVVVVADESRADVGDLANTFTAAVAAIRLPGPDRGAARVGASVGYAPLSGLDVHRALRLADAQAYETKAARRTANR
jgi:diguanylate cyclase (GGDEF)-like protein